MHCRQCADTKKMSRYDSGTETSRVECRRLFCILWDRACQQLSLQLLKINHVLTLFPFTPRILGGWKSSLSVCPEITRIFVYDASLHCLPRDISPIVTYLSRTRFLVKSLLFTPEVPARVCCFYRNIIMSKCNSDCATVSFHVSKFITLVRTFDNVTWHCCS